MTQSELFSIEKSVKDVTHNSNKILAFIVKLTDRIKTLEAENAKLKCDVKLMEAHLNRTESRT